MPLPYNEVEPSHGLKSRVTAFCDGCDKQAPVQLFFPTEDEWLPVDQNGLPTSAARSNYYCTICGTAKPAGRVLSIG